MTFLPFFVVVGNRPTKRNEYSRKALRQGPNSIFSFREPIWVRGLLASFCVEPLVEMTMQKPFHPGACPPPPCSCSTPHGNGYSKDIPLLILNPPSPPSPPCHSPSPPPPRPPGNGYAKSF